MTSSVRSIQLRKSPAVLQILEPGDRTVAGMVGTEGFWLLVSTLLSLILVLGGFIATVTTHRVIVGLLILIPCAVVNGAVWALAKVYFVVVTERKLICYRVSKLAWRLTRLLFAAPLAATHVTVGSQTPRGKSVRYSTRDIQRQDLHIYVGPRSTEDLDEVIAALRAGGASVTVRKPDSPG